MKPAPAGHPASGPGELVAGGSASRQTFLADAMAGLGSLPRKLPCKYFYDERGSALFERICKVPEYYPTRVELGIMREHVAAIAERLGERVLLCELGSGTSFKTRLLLRHLRRIAAYVPVDIDCRLLGVASASLREEFPNLRVLPLCADFSRALTLPPGLPDPARRVLYFPGSTIGNFEPDEARALLRRIRVLVGEEGGLLIGIDLKKDRGVLEAAYNDAEGVTAEFNLNLLRRLRDELEAEIDLGAFRHRAFYNENEGRVEMHLVARADTAIVLGGRRFDFREGESIHTESSYKYSLDEFAALCGTAALEREAEWTDARRRFGVQYYRAVPGPF